MGNTRNTNMAKVIAFFESDVEVSYMAQILRQVCKQYSLNICTLPEEDRPTDVKENLYYLHALQEVLEEA